MLCCKKKREANEQIFISFDQFEKKKKYGSCVANKTDKFERFKVCKKDQRTQLYGSIDSRASVMRVTENEN